MMTLEQIARQLDEIVCGINALSNEVFLVSERQKQMQLDLKHPPLRVVPQPVVSAVDWDMKHPVTVFRPPEGNARTIAISAGPTAAERRAMDQRAHALFGGSDPAKR